jgi:hypothetical protein
MSDPGHALPFELGTDRHNGIGRMDMNELGNCNICVVIKDILVRIDKLDRKGININLNEMINMADGLCYPCEDKSLSNCESKIKNMNDDCPCPLKNVIKDILERVEALESP